jgi:hypothetical protein
LVVHLGFALLVLLVTVPMLPLWLLMSRLPRNWWLVVGFLAGQIAVAVLLVGFQPRGRFEISLACLVVMLSTTVVARLLERRRLGPAAQRRVIVSTNLLAGWVLIVLCLGGVLLRPGPFFPDADEVLPLPDGLHATVNPSGDRDCGSGSCERIITVTGRTGQTGDELYAEVKRHVEGRGWGPGCRPVGWLLDRSTECVELTRSETQTAIVLSGTRTRVLHVQ